MTQAYHNREATTAHLQSVGLTFEGFRTWYYARYPIMCDWFPANEVREYIRENHTL